MTKRSEAQLSVYLRGYLGGVPVDYTALLAAVQDGVITDFGRIEVVFDRHPYLSPKGVSVPEELVRYPPSHQSRSGREASDGA